MRAGSRPARRARAAMDGSWGMRPMNVLLPDAGVPQGRPYGMG